MPILNVTLFTDPTPTSIINLRYVTTFLGIADNFTDFEKEEFHRFVRSLLYVGKKLVATWSHLHRYQELEDSLLEAAQAQSPAEANDIQHLSYAQDLFIEFDEFLVQLKSTLDYLAKLPRNIIGAKAWPELRTFGDKGRAVQKAVKNNIPQKWQDKAVLVTDLLAKYEPWIEMAVTARDKINHGKDGGLDFEAFVVAKSVVDGSEQVIVPMWTDGHVGTTGSV